MPKVPANLVQPEITSQPDINPNQQNTSEVIIVPLLTGQHSELIIPSTSAPVEAMRQVLPRTIKRTRKSPKYYGYDNDNSSGEPKISCPRNFAQPLKKRRAGNVASVQPSVVQTIMDTATRVEPIPNPFPWPVIGEVSPTDPAFGQQIRVLQMSKYLLRRIGKQNSERLKLDILILMTI